MNYRIKLLCIFLVCAGVLASGRQQASREKRRVFIEPRESVFPAVAQQPGCPLEFENAETIHYVGASGGGNYRVRNVSTKPIRGFKIATLDVGGGESLTEVGFRGQRELLLPGQVWPRPEEENRVEIVPLTKELKVEHNAGAPMKGIRLFMVVHVEFADGSVYSDEVVYKELKDFIEKVTIERD